MSSTTKRVLFLVLIYCAGAACALLFLRPIDAADAQPQPLKSKVVRWQDAASHRADWGEFRRYFGGTTWGTKNVLTAAAVVEPGKAVHRSHRHADEEYLVMVEGSGTWSLAGKELPAKRGDVMFVEPWVYHGLVNTGSKPLVFLVVRYSGKGVDTPPRPDNRPDEL